MRLRITAASVVVLALALLGGSQLLVTVLQDSLRDNVRATVRTRSRELAAALDAGTAPSELTLPQTDDLVAQVTRDDTIVVQSHTLHTDEPIRAQAGRVSTVTIRSEDDELLAAASLSGAFTVVVAGTPERADEAAAALRDLLAVAMPLVLVLLAASTWVAVGRALSPVDLMAAEVDAISLSDLHRRVPDDGHDELGRLGRTMNRMLDRLERAVVRQRQFVGDASHELRNPLASLRQQAEVAAAHPGRTTVSTLASGVLAETLRMQSLVENLLLLARVGEARHEFAQVEVDIDDLALQAIGNRDAVEVAAPAIAATRVRGDRAALQRVVDNLVANAVRHARSQVQLTIDQEQDTVILHVDDDGAGIAPDQRQRVFERFVRLDEARDRDSGGSGLGLSIAADIVAAHGGSITATDSPLGGARLDVRLPTFREPTAASLHADDGERQKER